MSRKHLSSPSSPSWDDDVVVDIDSDSSDDFAPPPAPSVPPSSLPWVGTASSGEARAANTVQNAPSFRYEPGAMRPENFPSAPTTLPSVDVSRHPPPKWEGSQLSASLSRSSSRPDPRNGASFGADFVVWLRTKLSTLIRTAAPASARPDSGLDTLRPYVGSRPQIILTGETMAPKTRHRVSRIYVLRGFTWGIALAATLFLARVVHYEMTSSSPATPLGRSLRVLDADALGKPPAQTKSLAERAAEGESEALEELRKKAGSSRSPEELAALAEGEEMRARRHAKAAVDALAKQKTFSEADKAEFFRHAGNQRTFREALLAMSANESEAGPDLIYDVTRRYRHQKDIASFAQALLVTPPVYKYASPALTVIIDAETITDCSEVRGLVDRVAEVGDARSIRHMAKFAKTTGCGQHGIEDCYTCLRGDRVFVDALRAARDRPAPY